MLGGSGDAAHCFVGTIMEYPDWPGDTRTGAACYSTPQDGIVVYLDTRTGIANSQTSEATSSFATTAVSSPATIVIPSSTETVTHYGSTATSTITSSSPDPPRQTEASAATSDGLSTGAKVGIGISVSIVGLVVLYLMRRQRNSFRSPRQWNRRSLTLEQAMQEQSQLSDHNKSITEMPLSSSPRPVQSVPRYNSGDLTGSTDHRDGPTYGTINLTDNARAIVGNVYNNFHY